VIHHVRCSFYALILSLFYVLRVFLCITFVFTNRTKNQNYMVDRALSIRICFLLGGNNGAQIIQLAYRQVTSNYISFILSYFITSTYCLEANSASHLSTREILNIHRHTSQYTTKIANVNSLRVHTKRLWLTIHAKYNTNVKNITHYSQPNQILPNLQTTNDLLGSSGQFLRYWWRTSAAQINTSAVYTQILSTIIHMRENCLQLQYLPGHLLLSWKMWKINTS